MTAEHDKLDLHHRQQISALMDGELSPDEARFLLRRLQHDGELSGCWDRWQLCGEALRGQALAPAPAGFVARVALAIAAEPALSATATHAAPASAPRGRLARWGGGALAASVALVALFMVRQQVPQDDAAEAAATPAIATATAPDSNSSSAASRDADSGTLADGAGAAEQTLASAAAATVAVASVPRRQDKARGSATRTQQAGRNAAAIRALREPTRAVASASPPLAVPTTAVANAPVNATRGGDPFSRAPVAVPQARPWPRSTLSPYPASGAFTAGFSSESAARTFYPFEPSLPPASTPAPQP